VLLGLLSIWNVTFLGYPARVSTYLACSLQKYLIGFFDLNWPCSKNEMFGTLLQAILPYSQALEKFAPHIQQASLLQHCA